MLQSSAGKLLQNSAEKSLAEKSSAEKSLAEKGSAKKGSAEKIHCKVRPRNVAKIGREMCQKSAGKCAKNRPKNVANSNLNVTKTSMQSFNLSRDASDWPVAGTKSDHVVCHYSLDVDQKLQPLWDASAIDWDHVVRCSLDVDDYWDHMDTLVDWPGFHFQGMPRQMSIERLQPFPGRPVNQRAFASIGTTLCAL